METQRARHTGALAENDLRQLRLRSQLLLASRDCEPAETVRHLLAVQAQNLGGALWSVGQRSAAGTRGDIEATLAAGVVVLTWPMRGTLHFVHADDAGWLLPLLTPRVAAGRGKLWRDAGLTNAVFDRAADVLFDALGSGPITRPEVLRILDEAGISTAGQRGSHLLRHLAERRVIIFGPRHGRTQTFMRYEDLIPAGGEIGREESLRLLALRYLIGHGPATEQDLAWWSGLTLRDARSAVAAAGPDLAVITVRDRRYYLDPEVLAGYFAAKDDVRAGDARLEAVRSAGAHDVPHVRLLPGFDEYHIGFADRRLILAAEDQATVGPGKNGVFRSPVVVDGVVAGIWSAAERKGTVTVEVSLFPGGADRTLPDEVVTAGSDMDRGVEAAAMSYGRFLGLDAVVGLRRL